MYLYLLNYMYPMFVGEQNLLVTFIKNSQPFASNHGHPEAMSHLKGCDRVNHVPECVLGDGRSPVGDVQRLEKKMMFFSSHDL